MKKKDSLKRVITLMLTAVLVTGCVSCKNKEDSLPSSDISLTQSESVPESVSEDETVSFSEQTSNESSKQNSSKQNSSKADSSDENELSSKSQSSDEKQQSSEIQHSSEIQQSSEVQQSKQPQQSSQTEQSSEIQQSSEVQPSFAESSLSSQQPSVPQQSSDTVQPSSSQPEQTETSSLPVSSRVPDEWRDNGIFSAYYDKAYKKMITMSLEEKIGQMLYARCPDYDAVGIAQRYHLGGYVLFGRDFADKSKDEVISNINSYINSQEIPMTISVDEEGGTVVRISSKPALYDHEFQSPRDVFSQGGMESIIEDAKEKASLLKSLNIDTNFAPVCDISTDESDFMYDRSLGQDTQTTCEFVKNFTAVSQLNGVSATLKHFPGYGNNVDTHTGIAIDERNYSEFEDKDFKPFRAGIDSGAHLVMVSHNIVNCMDSSKPASLSENVHDILRNHLNFTGIIVTDDLEMDAITEYTNGNSPAVSAVLAGNDMLTVGDSQIDSSVSTIKEAVQNGTIDEKTINRSVMRILAWKYSKS